MIHFQQGFQTYGLPHVPGTAFGERFKCAGEYWQALSSQGQQCHVVKGGGGANIVIFE